MNILDTIIEQKHLEVLENRMKVPIQELQGAELFGRRTLSLKKSLLKKDSTGIIAEFKRQSPSKGVINGAADVMEITRAYAAHGAAGLSVLTDNRFFGGANQDLKK